MTAMAPTQSRRVRVSVGSSSPGRHRIASTTSAGNSTTEEKMFGAISPAKMPPITPPADIHM